MLSLCWCEAWLMLLVEVLVKELGEALALVIRGEDTAGGGVGHLGDVIKDLGHTQTISRNQYDHAKKILDCYDTHHHAMEGKAAITLSRYLE